MKTQNQDKATKSVRIYENKITPAKGCNFSVSIPGFQSTQWFDKREQAETAIKSAGFKVRIDVPMVSITKSEHAALLEVVNAARELDDFGYGKVGRKTLKKALANLAAVQKGMK